jgi:tripartite-type tricarboxylate transporter receptor subunit TctC
MEEKTTDEVAAIFAAAGDSVTVINTAKTSDETTDEYNDKIKRNVEHLEIIKAYKKLDGTTSIWTSESFTAIDKAVVDGKKVYGG